MPIAPRSQRVTSLLLCLAVFPPAYLAASSAHQGPASPARGEGSSRTLSPAEIFGVIRDHLSRQGMPAAETLAPKDLRVQLAVQVAKGDTDVRVRRMIFDPIRHETRFQLWTPRDPGRPPFEVAAPWEMPGLEPAHPGASREVPAAWRVADSAKPLAQARTTKVRPKALVRLGRPATLVMLGNNTRITMTVVPLETGAQGEQIRVRNPANAHILAAEVVAEGLVRCNY